MEKTVREISGRKKTCFGDYNKGSTRRYIKSRWKEDSGYLLLEDEPNCLFGGSGKRKCFGC